MSESKWQKYAFEFLLILVAVISAFGLSNWNDQRKERHSEIEILEEIKNGLEKDIEDIRVNRGGHEDGLKACTYFVQLIQGEEVSPDTFFMHYFNLTRDFISIKNSSGYESLKSIGLDLIKNDSLRSSIISFYEYDLSILEEFEEDYAEMQFHNSYFQDINETLAPHLIFDSLGNIGIQVPVRLPDVDRNRLLANIWKIRTNRSFIMIFYGDVEEKVRKIVQDIEAEIER